MKKSHLEQNTVALLSACFGGVERENLDKFKDMQTKQNFYQVRHAIIDMMLHTIRKKNDDVGPSPAQSYGYVDKNFELLESLNLRQANDVRKIFDKVAAIATDVDKMIEYDLIAALSDRQFDELFVRLQKETGTNLNVEAFSLKCDIERQQKADYIASRASINETILRLGI